MTSSQIDASVLARVQAVLADAPALRLAVLFGSAAKGRLRPGSDLDVAILPVRPGDPELDDLSLQTALTLAAGTEVDLIRLDRASTLLKWEVAKNGSPLFERRPGELTRFRVHAASEYADFAPAFAHHAERFRRKLIAEGSGP
jgi:predicted nucleotidyltransferase